MTHMTFEDWWRFRRTRGKDLGEMSWVSPPFDDWGDR